MHEVALSHQLASAVQRAARGRTVLSVHLRIGALRQVVPESLEYAWGFVTKGSPMEKSEVRIDWVPAEIECSNGHRRILDPNEYLDVRCQECNAPTSVITGEEFAVVDIDVTSDR